MTQKNSGISVVEALLAAGLFGLIVTALLGALLHGETSSVVSGNRSQARMLAEEGVEVLRNIQDENFSLIGDLSDGTHYLASTTGVWTVDGSEAENINDMFSREIVINGIDGDTVEVTTRVMWNDLHNRTGLVELVTRFTNWMQNAWTQTTEAEFNVGKKNSVGVTNNAGGEVTLGIEGDWTGPEQHLLLDISGGQDAEALFEEDNVLWVARADQTLYKYDISNISNGVITELSTHPIGVSPTGLYINGNTAYIANTSGDEVIVFNLITNTVTTLISLPGNEAVTDITFANNKILITRLSGVSSEFYVYNSTGTTLLGVVEFGSNANAVVADNSYAYVATADSSELWIINYNNCTGGVGGNECSIVTKHNPVTGGDTDATAIHKVGNNVYMGKDDNRIYSFNVSNPSSISLNFTVDPGNDIVNDIYADENVGFVYLATSDIAAEGVNVVRISDQNVTDIDLSGTSAANELIKQGTYLYIASDDVNEIQVFKGGTGGWNTPELQDSYNTSGNDDANDVFISGNYAYVVTGDDFVVVNISDPTNVTFEDEIDFNFAIQDVFVSGDYAYLATEDNNSELIVVNISNPSNISIAGTFNLDGNENALAVWVSGTTAYVGTQNNNGRAENCTNSELYVLNVSNLSSISCSGSYDVGADLNDIQMNGNNAYLATGDSSKELLILNTSNPASITSQGSFDTTGNGDAYGLWYENNTVYLGIDNNAGNSDFYVLNVSNPASVSLKASMDTGETNRDVRVSGNYAYLATDDDVEGLTVINISSAGSGILSQVSGYNTASDCNGLDFDGVRAYMACENNSAELQIIGAAGALSNHSFEGWFTSSSFDSGSASTDWSSVGWTESGTGNIQFQLRTAPDSGGSPGTWTDWFGPSGAGTYYSDESGGETVFSTHSDGSNDQWIQYRAYLTTSSSATTPILQSTQITYE